MATAIERPIETAWMGDRAGGRRGKEETMRPIEAMMIIYILGMVVLIALTIYYNRRRR